MIGPRHSILSSNPEVFPTLDDGDSFAPPAFASGTVAMPIVAPSTPGVAEPDGFNTDAAVSIDGNLFDDNGAGSDASPGSIAMVNGSSTDVGHQITLASGALLKVSANGIVIYNPNHAFDALTGTATARETFTYTLSSGSTATVEIWIRAHNATSSTYTGTSGDDIIPSSPTTSLFDLSRGGDDTAVATGFRTNDGFKFGDTFTLADKIDGGDNTNDQMQLDGDYPGNISLASVRNVEVVALMPGHDYTITDPGSVFTFWAVSMTAANHVFIDAHSQGSDHFYLGAGNDTAIGGAGDDLFFGGDGQDTLTGNGAPQFNGDTFVYKAVSNSTSTSYDIIDFTSGSDKIDLPFTVTGVDNRINTGAASPASFDTDLAAGVNPSRLAPFHAMIYAPDTGTLSGHAFLIIDANGVAGYQAGQDYVIDVTGGIPGGNDGTTVRITDFI